MTAAVFDVDQFKMLNDTYGHHCGDVVLKQLANLIADRAADHGLVASRLGGDEFIMIGHGGVDLDAIVLKILHQIRSTPWTHRGAPIDVTVSIGVAHGRRDQVWSLADEAVYLAKAGGRDQLVVYDEDDPRVRAHRTRVVWADEVRRLISEDRLLLFGQPIVDITVDGHPPAYYEVLLRRPTSDGGAAGPGLMLEAAAEFGLIERLDWSVLRKALAWQAEQHPQPMLSINVSAPFAGSPRSIMSLSRLLEESGVAPDRVCIELTETTAISDLRRTAVFIDTIRRWGCKVAIDDFGSGWTSLPMVQNLGVDILKIDGSWIQKAGADPLARTVVTSTAEVARIIGVEVVAEWVEDPATVRFIKELGIRYGQGHLFGIPVPLDTIDVGTADAGEHRFQ